MENLDSLRSKNILVTGGAGSIGSHLVDELALDNNVTVLDNLLTGSLSNLSKSKESINFVKGDILDQALLDDLVRDNEYVFHLAANVGNVKSIQDPFLDMEINVKGTLNLLETCRHYSIKRLVFSSSAAVYGEAKYLPIDEDHPLNPESPYAVSKMTAEKYCFAYHKIYGVPTVSLRYFNVFGPRQRASGYANVIPVFMQKVKEGKALTVFGDGEQTRDFVFIKDVVASNIAAATHPGAVGGIFNVATGAGKSLKELISVLNELSGRHNSVNYSDPRAGEIKHSRANVDKAYKTFGFQTRISFKQGLAITWQES